MSLFGKILLFINLLGAGAVVYLSTQDWKKRQEITTTVLSHQLMIQGLPLDKPPHASEGDDPEQVPIVVRTPSGDTTEWMRKKPFDELMKNYGGGAKYGVGGDKEEITNLKAELARVEKKLDALVFSESVSATNKLRFLAGGYADGIFVPGLLMNLAETYTERETVRQLASKLPDEVNELEIYNKAIEAKASPLDALSSARIPKGDALEANAKTAVEMLKAKLNTLKELTRNPGADSQISSVRSLSDAVKTANEAVAKIVDEMNEPVDPNNPPARSRDELVNELKTARENATAAQEKLSEAMKGDSFKLAISPEEQRRQIAHFLMVLDNSSEWQNRVAILVGLKTYAKTVEAQANRLGTIARQVRTAIENDSATFVNDYELLRYLATEQDKLVQIQSKLVTGLKEMEAKDRKLTETRARQLEELKADLAQVRQQISESLERQTISEKTVFELQRKVSETLRGNLDLEKNLTTKELGSP